MEWGYNDDHQVHVGVEHIGHGEKWSPQFGDNMAYVPYILVLVVFIDIKDIKILTSLNAIMAYKT